jgi:hypothetical protein
MKNQTSDSNTKLIDKMLSGDVDKKYQGKQVVIIGGETRILPNDGRRAAKLVEKLEEKHPNQIPHLVSVPRPGMYIL